MKRENEFVESYKSLIENKNLRAEEHEKLVNEAVQKREKFINDYYSIREAKEMEIRKNGRLMESFRDDALGTAIKAIYISALEAGTLTDQGLLLAETMVDSWIKERGGASKILGECKNNSYLLSRISEIVEEAAILEVEELKTIENDEDAEEEETVDTTEEPVEDSEEVQLAAKVIEKNLDKNSDPELAKALDVILKKAGVDKEEETVDDVEADTEESDETATEEGETSEESEEEVTDKAEEEAPKDESSDKEDDTESKEEEPAKEEEESSEDTEEETPNTDEDEATDDGGEDDEDPLASVGLEDEEDDDTSDDSEVADEIIEDDEESEDAEEETEEIEDDIEVEDDEESDEDKGKIFDDLEKEEDVKKAVELIRQRVADAEETFIKRNAEDKKKVDELIGKISDNIKTVEDIDDKEDTKSQIAEESARMYKQKISQITENRPLTILEKMTRSLTKSIVKDESVREQYLTEDGNMDTVLVVESAKVMYGFLETLNTLQLEKVDSEYIRDILDKI